MIVVDVGCASIGTETSTMRLIKRFSPSVYYGFDPLVDESNGFVGLTRVILDSRAAWIRDGSVPFLRDTTRSSVVTAPQDAEVVECFDLSRFIIDLPRDDLVVKLDVEGAEYALIDKMEADAADTRISLLIVEWHDVLSDSERWRERLLKDVRCPVETWE